MEKKHTPEDPENDRDPKEAKNKSSEGKRPPAGFELRTIIQ